MKLLPHWVITNDSPAFYDTDSGTAIEQTAKVYAAMNELIVEYNNFVDSTNAKIEEFTSGVISDNETFRVALRQEFQDFINVVELKIEALDQYTKNEIGKEIEKLYQDLKETGEFTELFENELETVKISITDLKSALETDIERLENQAAENHEELSRVINRLETRRFILIADSYGVGTSGGGAVSGWTSIFKTNLHLDDVNCYISQIGGSGFVGNVETTFENLLETVNASSPETITDIVCCGGWNDADDNVASITTAINSFCDKAKTLYPNAKIHIGMVGASTDTSPTRKKALFNNSLKAYSGTLNESDYHYLENVENILRVNPNSYMSSDNIHPTLLGYQALAHGIIKAVNGGLHAGVLQEDLTLTGVSDVTIEECDVQRTTINGITRFDFNKLDFSTTKAMTPTTYVEIGTFSTVLSGDNPHMQTAVTGFASDSGGKRYSLNAKITIANNKLFITILNCENGAFVANNKFTRITIMGGSICVPTVLY